MASRIFRASFFSRVSRNERATCCVIVEAPCAIRPSLMLVSIARAMPMKSSPECSQNAASSADTNALRRFSGISSKDTT